MGIRSRVPARSTGGQRTSGVAEPRPGPTAVAALLSALPALALYVATLHPGLPAGDSGELISVAATGGVAHPPGYPLYTMLAGVLLRLLPVGNVAWRLNLFSALCMAAASGVLAAAVTRGSRSVAGGVFAGLVFATATVTWRYALVAEVFALHALLAAGVLLVLTLPPRRACVVLAFMGALSLSHHHTLLLLVIPAWIAMFVRAARAVGPAERGRVRWTLLATCTLAALAGLLPLLWIPFAARHHGALVWGDATTLRGFLSILLRAEYGTFRLDAAGAGYSAEGSQWTVFASALPRALGWLALALAAVGAMVLARRQRAPALALLAYAAAQSWFFTRIGFPADSPLLRGVVERFYILPVVVLAFAAGIGSAWLLEQLREPRARRVLAASLLTVVAAVAVPRVRAVSERGNTLIAGYGRALLASLPPHAVLFTRGDTQHNALEYLRRVEHLRPDVSVLDQELLTYPWYVRQVRAHEPGLLPVLTRAQRITLADGRKLEGLVLRRDDGTSDLLTQDGQSTVPSAQVASVTAVASESLYAGTRKAVRTGALLELGDDRYSGLPGSRNLVWLDHLSGRRPVAFAGLKEESCALRYMLTPVGMTDWVGPRGMAIAPDTLLAIALEVAAEADLGAYFRQYAPSSFEQAEKHRFPELVTRAALLLCQPFAAPVVASRRAGHERVLEFARRFEALEPSPDPRCLRAIGFLRVFDPRFRDPTAARRDIERALAMSPDAARDTDAQAVLRALAAGTVPGIQPGR